MNVLGADNKRCQSMREHDGVQQGSFTASAVTRQGVVIWLTASYTCAVVASCNMWSEF
jgi:hypothetical protein